MSGPAPSDDLIKGDAGVELASHRTSLSFERTRMGADNTLMATVRTSLSLISFGFTIYQVLGKASAIVPKASEMARNLGLGLLILGLANLVMGLISHALFSRGLTQRRADLFRKGLLRREVRYHATPTYIVAFSLLALGLGALATMVFRLMS
jgi:putative membrane protein